MVQSPPEKDLPKKEPVDIGQLITCDPQIQGGRPTIAGTGMTVRQVVDLHEGGQSVEDIVAQKDYLSPAQVYAALAYYHANEKAVDVKLVDEVAEYEKVLAAQPEWWKRLYLKSAE
ncbi:MAG: DUF433 domain-containing protein, partial [Cyanobacteria bacterium J06627_15]